MTQQEFESRTQVTVSTKEFDAINTVYLASDLDKDAFCKMWCKMNANRVLDAKVNRIAAEYEQANRDFAWNLCNSSYTQKEFQELADNYFNKYEKHFLETRLHISMQAMGSWGYPYFRTVSDVLWECNKYLFPNA